MLRWVNWVGEKLINYAEIEIGGQRIDKHYGEWLHIWNQLSNSASHDEGYQRMVSNITKLTTSELQVQQTVQRRASFIHSSSVLVLQKSGSCAPAYDFTISRS